MFPGQLNPRDYYHEGTKRFWFVSAYAGKIAPKKEHYWQQVTKEAGPLPLREFERRQQEKWEPTAIYFHSGKRTKQDPTAWVAIGGGSNQAFVVIDDGNAH